MGRNKKTLPPSKEKRVTIRMTDDLYDVITEGAKTANLPKTEYIRKLLTEKEPVVHYEVVFDNPELLKALGDMGKVGSNLNQIARHLNQGGVQTDELKQEIRNCISCIYEMRDEIKEMAGNYRGNHQTHRN